MQPLPRRRLGTGGPRDHHRRLRRLGRRRRRLVVRLGAAGRRRLDRRDPPRGRPRRELGRHGGRLRPRALRGGGGPRDRRHPAPERPLVFTKCGLRWNPNDPMEVSTRDSSPARIREECEASLRRLGVEAIDLYQFHWPDQSGTPLADSWGNDAEAAGRGQGPLRRRLELHDRAPRRLRAARPRAVVPAALLARCGGTWRRPSCRGAASTAPE